MSLYASLKARLDAERLRVFGDDITYTPLVGSPEVIRMTKSRPPTMDPVEIGRYVIRWALLASFTVAPQKKCQIQVDSTNYTVVDLRYDEYGGVFLIANR